MVGKAGEEALYPVPTLHTEAGTQVIAGPPRHRARVAVPGPHLPKQALRLSILRGREVARREAGWQ